MLIKIEDIMVKVFFIVFVCQFLRIMNDPVLTTIKTSFNIGIYNFINKDIIDGTNCNNLTIAFRLLYNNISLT